MADPSTPLSPNHSNPCRTRPRGDASFCIGMGRMLNSEPNGHQKGLSFMQMVRLPMESEAGGLKTYTGGVAYMPKAGSTKSGIWLNWCPWCGASLRWQDRDDVMREGSDD